MNYYQHYCLILHSFIAFKTSALVVWQADFGFEDLNQPKSDPGKTNMINPAQQNKKLSIRRSSYHRYPGTFAGIVKT
jgi:hypothetical protein